MGSYVSRLVSGLKRRTSGTSARAGMEQLEDRTLMSAAVLNLPIDYPSITFDGGGSMSYDPATHALHAQGTPFAYRQSAAVPPVPILSGSVKLDILVDNTGALIGGVAGSDLVIQGQIDVDGDGTIDYSGTLLTGDVLEFGAFDSGTTDQYAYRFAATGGALVAAGYFTGEDIGIQTNSGNSTYVGDWTVAFGGTVEGKVGPTVRPDIDVEKYVKPVEDMSLEGFTPGFWKQCQHLQYWTGYKTTDSFEKVFGVNISCSNPTLLSALSTGGGGQQALMRQAVAALLNASNDNVNYLYSAQDVIQMVQQAFASGQYDQTTSLLETQNNLEGDITKGITPGFGIDADSAPGLSVAVGTPVIFTYVVTNPGGASLADVVLTDDNATPGKTSDDFHPAAIVTGDGFNVGDVNMNNRLDPGEQWLYSAITCVKCAGQFKNIAVVTGTPVDANGTPIAKDVSDTDVAYYIAKKTSTGGCGGCGDHGGYSGGCGGYNGGWGYHDNNCGTKPPVCVNLWQQNWRGWNKAIGRGCGLFSYFGKGC